jgi:hypothetical protein
MGAVPLSEEIESRWRLSWASLVVVSSTRPLSRPYQVNPFVQSFRPVDRRKPQINRSEPHRADQFPTIQQTEVCARIAIGRRNTQCPGETDSGRISSCQAGAKQQDRFVQSLRNVVGPVRASGDVKVLRTFAWKRLKRVRWTRRCVWHGVRQCRYQTSNSSEAIEFPGGRKKCWEDLIATEIGGHHRWPKS